MSRGYVGSPRLARWGKGPGLGQRAESTAGEDDGSPQLKFTFTDLCGAKPVIANAVIPKRMIAAQDPFPVFIAAVEDDGNGSRR